ncbi:MAG: bifunctional hydroxymethylpyrimidine kinase/phosphomethylpyrimidine kinase [Oscillospiraceae bacterium]
MYTVLSIAGSDSSGGAGIQADLKTMLANGVYGMSCITALTAQNTQGVAAVQEVSPVFLQQQIAAVCEDIPPDAVKIGMVPDAALAEVIGQQLRKYRLQNIVVDPVMVATSGAALSSNGAVIGMQRHLFPMATVITPNLPETEVLMDRRICSAADMEYAANSLHERFGCAVLVKGGHLLEDANDVLCCDNGIQWLYGKRIANPNTHGTGCTLSSAIAANLAKGYALPQAIQQAKAYLEHILSAKLNLGKGSGPLHHGFELESAFAK